MKEMYTPCYSIKQFIFLLCCGDHVSNMTFTDAKAKYRFPCLFWDVLGT